MSEQSIYDALNQYFGSNVASIPGATAANIAYLGQTYVPEANTPFIALSMPSFRDRNITIGEPALTQWDGIYQITCFYPIGTGVEEVTQQKDAVAALFPNGFSLTTSDNLLIRFYRANRRPNVPADAWIAGPVQIPWFLHEST